MAVQAATQRRGASLQVYSLKSFQGLDVRTSPLQLANTPQLEGRLTLADNVVFPVTGGVSKRLDRSVITTTSLGASVTVTNGFQLRLSSGTDRVIVGTDDGRLVRVDTDGSTTDLATGLTAGTRWVMTQYNDLCIAVNGGDAPRQTTGLAAATTTLPGAPPATASYVAAHGNRVFMLDNTEPSRLSGSALNNEADWTAAANAFSFFVGDNDGSNCVALVPSIGELVILKGRRAYRLQGTSPSTYALTNLVPTTGSVGAISRQAAFFALNDVWWLSTAGVHNLATTQRFGDLRESFVSEPIEPYFRSNTALTVSLHRLTTGVGVYDSQNNALLFAVDADDDGQNELILVYDIATKAWSAWPSYVGIASMWPVVNATNGLTEIWAGGYDGHVRVLNRDVSTNAIDGHLKHISCLGTPGLEKTLRHLFIYAKEEGDVNLTVTVTADFGLSGGVASTVSLLGNSHTLGVNWVLGVDPLGSQGQIVRRLDLGVTGEYFEIAFRNQEAGESFTIYGYEAMSRPRRVVRAMR